MKKYDCWMNISLDRETLKDARTFAKEFRAMHPAGTPVSLSAAMRTAITEGIKSFREKFNAGKDTEPFQTKAGEV